MSRRSLSVLSLLLAAPLAFAQAPAIVDTHSHIQPTGRATDFGGSLDAAIRRMDVAGIRSLIVMPPPMAGVRPGSYDIEDFRASAQPYPGRIFLGGGGGTLNPMIQGTAPEAVDETMRQAFRTRAEQIAASGAVAFGEIALHHLSLRPMGPQHPYEWIAPDHPLMMLLADIAAEKSIAIDLHMDLVPQDMSLPGNPAFNPTNPPVLKANLAAFERLLAHDRRAKFVWAHAGTDPLGTRTPNVQRELLSRHPNLYMSLRLARGGPIPTFALTPDLRLKPEWAALLRDFPDRFVIGSDFFYGTGSGTPRGPAEETLGHYRSVLADLPSRLAEAIGHANAEKIYRMPSP